MTTLKFSNEQTADNFINHATKIMQIVLGDDGKFWVVTPATAAELEKQGYEILR